VRKFDVETLLGQHVLRIAIECEAVRRCTERISDRQLTELTRLARRVDQRWDVDGKVVEGRSLDIEFHLTIARWSGVSSLVQALESIPLVRLMEVDDAPDGGKSVPNRTHAELVRAIRSRDVARAEQAMREHCEYSMSLHLRSGLRGYR
jgi:DNA-binding GntR family transcriptional regulator